MHGGKGDSSVSGGVGAIIAEAQEAMSSEIDEAGGPSREWWAVFGTVTGSSDGLGLMDCKVDEDGGKYLFLYVLSTPASSCLQFSPARLPIKGRAIHGMLFCSGSSYPPNCLVIPFPQPSRSAQGLIVALETRGSCFLAPSKRRPDTVP